MRDHASTEQHLYGYLMREMAADWEAGGSVRTICQGWEQAPPGSVVQLRLLAGLFRIVLTGRAPQLVEFYPCLGGAGRPQDAWPHVRDVLAEHVDELREALDVPPQTNEVGRSAALLVGMSEAVRRTGTRRVRLLELGASAGLNLLVDRFRFSNADWDVGPEDSFVVLRDTVVGQFVPTDFEVVERRGCDLAPIDPQSAEGRLRLTSFVWPFHLDRHDRLIAALDLAVAHPVVVDPVPAGQWLESQLDAACRSADRDILTVVWQSVTRMYWPADEMARVQAALDTWGRSLPVAHVAMEYPDKETRRIAELSLALYGSGTNPVPVRLATVGDHGIPVTMAGRSACG